MDTAQWPQGIGVMKTLEIGSRHQQQHQQQQQQAMLGGGESRKATTTTTRPTKDHKAAALNCPRCNSSNTKFCYYNNYSLSQPRYFCKTCRRYWTEGGSLRNVPVGGGSRKNKRSSLSHLQPNSSNSTSSSSQNPKIIHEGQDLNLAYPPPSTTNTTTLEDHHHHNYNNIPKFIQLPYLDPKNQHPSNPNNPNPNFSAMELLKTNDHHHENMYSSSGFGGMQEFKQPTLSFSLDGFDQNGYGGGGGGGVQQQNGGARLLFPFEDLKNVSSTTSEFLDDHHHNRGGQGQQAGGDSTSNGYWSGMLGGGSW